MWVAFVITKASTNMHKAKTDLRLYVSLQVWHIANNQLESLIHAIGLSILLTILVNSRTLTIKYKDMETINERMKAHPTMKRILADSFGGVLYNVANRDKYNSKDLLKVWDRLSDSERSSCDGIVTGAINFIKGK